jgi:hypothetical protein
MEAVLELEEQCFTAHSACLAPPIDCTSREQEIAWLSQNGYMTGDEFERRVIEGLEQRLKANGYL